MPESAQRQHRLEQDREVDLLVVGAGAGGMSAALVGALEGLDVLLCESTDQVGGTAATSAGTIWIPGNHQSEAAGHADTVDAARRYLRALIGPAASNAVLEAFLQSGAEAVDYLGERSAVQFLPCGKHPDYRSGLPGAGVAGRALAPVPFDGRLLGGDFIRLRPPIREFLLLGGMMVGKEDIPRLIKRYRRASDFLHAARLFARYRFDRLRYPRGTRLTMGNALVARLFYSLRQRRVPILFGARVHELIEDSGRVAGALIGSEDGRFRIGARCGVVLATGGIGHHAALRARLMPRPTPVHSLCSAGNVGDGVVMAGKVGAALVAHAPTGLWAPVSVTHRADGSEGLYPHLVLDRAKPGVIAVNAVGARFVDEGVSYHDFVEAMFASHRRVPSIPAYLICDSVFLRKYGLGAVFPGERNVARFEQSGYLCTAGSLEELASRLGIDAQGLRDTVLRFNAMAERGEDLDFGRGTSEVCRFNGDPTHAPNPCLGPLRRPPFHAVTVWPAEIATSSGIAANEHAQALDEENRPIPGLYVCGNDMASVMQGTYPGPGTTLGPGITFGYRAARHAARARMDHARMEDPGSADAGVASVGVALGTGELHG